MEAFGKEEGPLQGAGSGHQRSRPASVEPQTAKIIGAVVNTGVWVSPSVLMIQFRHKLEIRIQFRPALWTEDGNHNSPGYSVN